MLHDQGYPLYEVVKPVLINLNFMWILKQILLVNLVKTLVDMCASLYLIPLLWFNICSKIVKFYLFESSKDFSESLNKVQNNQKKFHRITTIWRLSTVLYFKV
jgi:hypothetical protein